MVLEQNVQQAHDQVDISSSLMLTVHSAMAGQYGQKIISQYILANRPYTVQYYISISKSNML